MLSKTQLSELLLVKFCHDLSGPIGAINNGVELLKEDSNISKQATELVEGSARDLTARLLFFRHAFGTSNNSSTTKIDFLKELSKNFFSSKKVNVNWINNSSNHDADIPGNLGKLLLNLILSVSGTLIYGGSISVYIEKNQEKYSARIRAEGKMIKADSSLINWLEGKDNKETIDARNVHSYLIYHLINQNNIASKMDLGEAHIEVLLE